MKDNEIIKALECCINTNCGKCPMIDREDCDLDKLTLDLINCQKAEIERLQKHNTEMARKHYQDGKAEAVKEFAERFENALTDLDEYYIGEEHENFISANKVIALLVNLVKEKVGED